MTTITTADFFCGLGGFTTGAKAAGVRPLFAANHHEDAIFWHAMNHEDVEHVQQDLGEMDMRAVPDVDLLIASPDCRGFSPNGRPGRTNQGAAFRHKANRNTAWAVTAAAEAKRPRNILVENVEEMRSEWPLFESWLGVFRELGYSPVVHSFNAQDFGVPQDRDRILITLSLDGPVHLSAPGRTGVSIADCLDAEPTQRWQPIETKRRTKVGKKGSVASRMRAAQERMGGRPCLWANVDSAVPRGLEGVFPTITTKSIGQFYLIDGDRCRTLSARELARGQGFPDTILLPEKRELAGLLIGNAIPPKMAESAIGQIAATIRSRAALAA